MACPWVRLPWRQGTVLGFAWLCCIAALEFIQSLFFLFNAIHGPTFRTIQLILSRTGKTWYRFDQFGLYLFMYIFVCLSIFLFIYINTYHYLGPDVTALEFVEAMHVIQGQAERCLDIESSSMNKRSLRIRMHFPIYQMIAVYAIAVHLDWRIFERPGQHVTHAQSPSSCSSSPT